MKTIRIIAKRLMAVIIAVLMVSGMMPMRVFADQHAVFKSTPSNLTAKVGDPLSASMTLDMSLVKDEGGASVIELEKNNGTSWFRFLSKSYGEAAGGELNESLGIRTVGQVDKFRWRVNTTDAGWQYSEEFTATWIEPTVTTISSVDITGVIEPTVGGTAQTSGMTVTTPGVKIEDADTNWVIEVPGGWLRMSNDGYFSAGETYGIQVQLAPTDTDSYQFADTVTVTLNGHMVGTVEKFGYQDRNRRIIYSFGKLSSAPSIETGGLPDGEVGVAYNEALTASGSDPITWSIESGSLPPGLILGGDAIGGTPTTTGTYTFTVKAENSAGFDTLALSIVINAAVTIPSITTTTLPSGTCNAPYSQTLSATGTAPITWSVESGALPDGLSISGDTIAGTPTAVGTFNFTVKAANSGGNDTKSLSITIDPITISSVTITGVHEPAVGETPTYADITTSTPGVTIKTSYGFGYWFYDDGGTWYTMSGLFQAGKTHAIKFVIEPSSTAYVFADDLAVTVNGNTATEVTGSGNNRTVLRSFGQLTSTPAGTAPVITTTSLANATYGKLYSQTLSATGTGVLTWTLESGSLPSGLRLVSGQIGGGAPKATGSYTFTIKVSNSVGSDTKTFTLVVNPGTVSEVEVHNVQVPVAGQTPSTHSMSSGTPGIIFDSDNIYYLVYEDGMWKKTTSAFETGKKYGVQISFKPWANYSFADTVTATVNGNPVESITKTGTDLANRTVIYNFGVLGAPAGAPVITSASLANGTIGEPYGVALAASGNEPITWTLESGTLPPGLTMSGRTISGGPSAAGTYNFTVKATNSVGSDTKALSITIAPATVSSVKVDVKAPEAGQMPTLHMAVSTSSKGVTIDADNTYYLVYEGGAWKKTTTAFETGKTYGIQVTLKAITDYSFEDTVMATVNGNPVESISKSGPGLADRKIIYSFGVLSDPTTASEIAKAEISVTAPKTGEIPATSATPSDTKYTVASLSWDPEDSPFKADTAYTTTVKLEAAGTDKFTGNTKFYVNGEEATLVAPNPITGAVDEVTVSYTFAKTDADTSSTEYTVTLNGGGSGAMGGGTYKAGEIVTIKAGTRTDATFDVWYSTDVAVKTASDATTTFTMPAKNVTVKATWIGSGTHTTHTPTLVPAKDPTFTTNGNIEYYECYCGKYFKDAAGTDEITDHDSVIIPMLDYEIIKGGNSVYVKGSGATLEFTANGPEPDCTGVLVDGAEIATANYTRKSGSTIITLNNAYLETLAEGSHELIIQYGRREEAKTRFTVKKGTQGGANTGGNNGGSGRPTTTTTGNTPGRPWTRNTGYSLVNTGVDQ